jgi:hypothetical protein
MARAKSSSSGVSTSTATIGFEAKLWLTADKLRNKMNAGESQQIYASKYRLNFSCEDKMRAEPECRHTLELPRDQSSRDRTIQTT